MKTRSEFGTLLSRTKTFAALLALALLAVTPAACDSESGGSDSEGEALTGGATCEGDVCTLTGTITESLTLTADRQWLLRGGVFIGDDVNETVLTIEPGTTIFGEASTQGMLVVRRGSRIEAAGTADAPIVFTSSKAPASRTRGDWGGVIINGRATVNSCAGAEDAPEGPCEAFGEGGTGWYGGGDDTDSSGTLRYVRIEFAGRLISPENELNGLALQGVGSGTTLEYIQIHMGKDDGIEFFGGTVNFKYILTSGIADDNLDWTDGWRGKGQFFVAVQFADAGDNGIEADNNAEDNGAAPRSRPTLSNVTLVGIPDSEHSDVGVLLREGTAANISNLIVVGWNDVCLDLDHDETFANASDGDGALSGELTIENSIVSCATDFDEEDGDAMAVSAFFSDMNAGNAATDPQLEDAWNEAAPDFRPAAGSPAASGGAAPADPFFTQVDFLGGVDPSADWTAGWTTWERN